MCLRRWHTLLVVPDVVVYSNKEGRKVCFLFCSTTTTTTTTVPKYKVGVIFVIVRVCVFVRVSFCLLAWPFFLFCLANHHTTLLLDACFLYYYHSSREEEEAAAAFRGWLVLKCGVGVVWILSFLHYRSFFFGFSRLSRDLDTFY